MAFRHFELAFPAHFKNVLAIHIERQLVEVRHDPGNQAVHLDRCVLTAFRRRFLPLPNLAHDFQTPFQEHRRVQSFAVVDGIWAAGDLAQHFVDRASLASIAANNAVVRGVARAVRGGGRRRLNNRILNLVVVFLHYALEVLAVSRLGGKQVRVQLDEVDREDLRLARPEEPEHLEVRVRCSGRIAATACLVGPLSVL